MPTITQLEYIIAVEKHRHFGLAARLCHVSQPSLSAQIQKVEEELGFIIFDRIKKPILPTQKGKQLIEQAKVVLHEQQKLIDIAKFDASVVSGNFRLGIIPTIAPYLLPLIINAFSKNFPRVDLQIDELKTESILLELKNDSLDAAILAGPLHEDGIRERVLYYEPFYLYLGKNHPLLSKQKIQATDLDGSDMWLLQDGHCFRNQVVKVCSIKNESSVLKNIRFEGGTLETLRYLIQKSHGYTLVPELFVRTLSETEKKNHVRPLETPAPSREVCLVFRRNQWKSDILKAIQGTVEQNLPDDLALSLDKKKNRVIQI